jgi:MFS family permease
MPENISGILLPLKLKTAEGEAGATLYGYLSSFNGLIVILFTPLFTYLLSKVKEIPKIAIGSFLSALGLVFYMLTNNAILLFVGMFFITVGEVTNVLGSNPYHSKRIPLSHRGRIGGVLSLVHGIFSALIQYLIGVLLLVSSNNYSLIFLVFVIVGVLVSILCIFAHKKDKDTFPLLYVKEIVDKN